MEIAVLHYHFRPGGVRRLIELGLPAIVRAAGVKRAVLASGEAPDTAWRERIEAAVFPCATEWVTEPALGYWSEQNAAAADVRGAIRSVLGRIVPRGGVLWAHNLSVGRNMLLAEEISRAAGDGSVWLHHHDWWWDGRWERWPEMAGQGVTSLEQAVRVTLPNGDGISHFCVSADDAALLREWTGMELQFLPNPIASEPATAGDVAQAREFLRRLTAAEKWWIYPCRGLRRKNIAEALLMQRWLRPEAATITSGAASSAEERGYVSTLTDAAAKHGWRLHAGVCATTGAPDANALVAAADAVVLSSLREGFGLAWHEAAAAGRPLFARIPPGMDETFRALDFTFSHGWRELRVPHEFYDRDGEQARVAAGRHCLKLRLPTELHELTENADAVSPEFRDFGGLTLAAQLEVLTQPVEVIGHALRSLHPELETPPSPQKTASNGWSPEKWAAELLQRVSLPAGSSFREDWPRDVVRILTPLLLRWLRCPLLWAPC
jgi:hypothetical protein